MCRVDSEKGDIILTDSFVYKKTAVLEFRATVSDRNGINLQNDTGKWTSNLIFKVFYE